MNCTLGALWCVGMSQPKVYDARLCVAAGLKCSGLSVKLQVRSCLEDLKPKPGRELRAAPTRGGLQAGEQRGDVGGAPQVEGANQRSEDVAQKQL